MACSTGKIPQCPYKESCLGVNCDVCHPYKPPPPCKFNTECRLSGCGYTHPPGWVRPRDCRNGKACYRFGCDYLHPPKRPHDCRNGKDCKNPQCTFLHPTLCKFGNECKRPVGTSSVHQRKVTMDDILEEVERDAAKKKADENWWEISQRICGGSKGEAGICSKAACKSIHLHSVPIEGGRIMYMEGSRDEANLSVKEFGRVCTWHFTEDGCTDKKCEANHLKRDSEMGVWFVIKRPPSGSFCVVTY